MFERGWPLTKAAYLLAATLPDTPDFPLDTALRTSIPDKLEGKLPEFKEEYTRVRFSLPGPAPSASSATSDSTIRPSVASLPPEPDEERALPDAQQQHNLLEEERRALAALGLPPFREEPEER